LGVASSMRSSSQSTRLLKYVLNKTLAYNAEVRSVNLFDSPMPFYRPTKDAVNDENVKIITRDVCWANAYILASPDYHGSISGTLKNFLDYFWKEFAGKTFGYIVASHEGGLTVMDQMRTAVRQCYGWSMPYGISVNSAKDLDKFGEFADEKLISRVEMLARDIVVYGGIIYRQFLIDKTSKVISFANRYNE
jgi:NAD(P)H-dependent FMN reductase